MADLRSLVQYSRSAPPHEHGNELYRTKEAPVHENVKKALVAATELDTRLVMRALRKYRTVLKNAGVDRLIDIEREKARASRSRISMRSRRRLSRRS